MKPTWILILCGLAIVAASFAFAVIEGANAAQRDAARAETTLAAR